MASDRLIKQLIACSPRAKTDGYSLKKHVIKSIIYNTIQQFTRRISNWKIHRMFIRDTLKTYVSLANKRTTFSSDQLITQHIQNMIIHFYHSTKKCHSLWQCWITSWIYVSQLKITHITAPMRQNDDSCRNKYSKFITSNNLTCMHIISHKCFHLRCAYAPRPNIVRIK